VHANELLDRRIVVPLNVASDNEVALAVSDRVETVCCCVAVLMMMVSLCACMLNV
jgi:hypothetical protein